MQLNDIDNLYKKGIEEAENRSEYSLLQAKPKVWEAIYKPKPKNRQHWLLITSLAATLSLFAIATFLFLKLESTQNKLETLQSEVNTKVPTENWKNENESMALAPQKESITDIVTEHAPAEMHNNIEMDTEMTLKKVMEEGNPYIADPIVALEAPTIDPIAEIDLAMIPIQEIVLEPKSPEPNVKVTSNPKLKKKLKFRIGNGNTSNHDGQKTLAFNISL